MKNGTQSRIRSLCLDENGQALSEYALMVVFIGFTAMVLAKLLPGAIRGYLRRIYMVVSSPFP
jgi:hypothetical protein